MHEYVFDGYGEVAVDPCAPCYEQKSESYRSCQQLPAGSADRETCFRRADADFGTCLDACGGNKVAGAGVLLLGGLAALVLLS